MSPINQPPPPESFDLIKWAWSVMLLPIGWIASRHARLSVLMDSVRTDMAALKAHSERTREDINRIGTVLDRIEGRMNQRRGED